MINQDTFSKQLQNMQPRLGMYIGEINFSSLTCYLDGYLECYALATGHDLSKDFRQWMFAKYKTHFSLHEAWYIFYEVAQKDQQLAIDKLFENWHEFLASCKK